jgi:hypothetical protein
MSSKRRFSKVSRRKGKKKAAVPGEKRREEFSANQPESQKDESSSHTFLKSHLNPQSILQLQRRYGNAAVNRIISQTSRRSPDVMLATGPTAVESAFIGETLSTNVEYADWILRAHALGFVKFPKPKSGKKAKASKAKFVTAKDNLEELKKGKKVAAADPSGTAILHSLFLMHDIVTHKINGWIAAGAPATKPTVTFGSYLTWKSGKARGGAHGSGSAVDIVGMETTRTVDKVIEIIDSLPIEASYRLGMPFEGDFFDPKDNIENREKVEAAKTTPGPIKDALEIEKAGIRKSTWNSTTKKWKRSKEKGGVAWTKLISPSLKVRILKARKEFQTKGFRLMVFPDAPGHLHARREDYHI